MECNHKIRKIMEIVSMLSKNSGKIICCCGCFDIFHIGHLEYLTMSKKMGNILIVGVNSDESYLRLKKKNPIFDVNTRMAIVAGLECVDYVFSFSDVTFCNSLLTIKPHIYATGIDHKEQHMEEEDVCRDNNIGFVYIGERKKASSSILQKELLKVT